MGFAAFLSTIYLSSVLCFMVEPEGIHPWEPSRTSPIARTQKEPVPPPPPQPDPPALPGECTSKKRKKADNDMYCLRILPKWVTDLVMAEGGTDIHFIADKTIEKSDLGRQQSRISLPKNFVKANLVPMLSELERESASLDGDDRERSRVTEAAEVEKRKMKVSGREHGGLPVVVFTRCSFLKEGDEVATWAFRRGGDLCFVIGQPTSASSSSCASLLV
ncbi:hypothetical protein B296_00001001 [Ensete ventricosum]|uniref:Uncharacterized protein n=1 Tax=Ensete ventricosum TaxID=4639 RepID=A0A427B9S9_ENSVE|nr:hypothetical protein B296_00001001 [Ensete ventricosum]